MNVILIKPAELFLKSDPVMKQMTKQLYYNISKVVKPVEQRRLYFVVRSKDVKKLSKIPGISLIIPAVEVETNVDVIKKKALEMAKGLNSKKSFAVRVKRSDKVLGTTRELEFAIGGYIQEAKNAKVDLSNPDVLVNIEIHKDKTYIYSEVIRGVGGLPEGVTGKVVVIEGKNSEVASFMMRKRGCYVIDFKGTLKKAEKFAIKNNAKALVVGDTNVKKYNVDMLVFAPLIGLSSKQIKKLRV